MQQPGTRQIIDILAPAPQESKILDPLDGETDIGVRPHDLAAVLQILRQIG